MTRHSRNCTSNPVYSYHEAKKDSHSGNYGTLSSRCAKESIKDFDCCSISLQPCIDPVVTPQGYLFDKAIIIEYILTKKKKIKEQLIEYDKFKEDVEKNSVENRNIERKKRKFLQLEGDILPLHKKVEEPYVARLSSQFVNHVKTSTDQSENKEHKLGSFWVPSLTPNSGENNINMENNYESLFKHKEQPNAQVLCPFSGKPLKLKDLIPVNFKKIIKDGDLSSSSNSNIPYTANSGKYNYICAVTGDVINNNVPSAVLRTSGSVVTMECVKTILSKDLRDPINGKPLRKPIPGPLGALSPDIIPLQRGGTGFVSATDNPDVLKPRHKTPALHI